MRDRERERSRGFLLGDRRDDSRGGAETRSRPITCAAKRHFRWKSVRVCGSRAMSFAHEFLSSRTLCILSSAVRKSVSAIAGKCDREGFFRFTDFTGGRDFVPSFPPTFTHHREGESPTFPLSRALFDLRERIGSFPLPTPRRRLSSHDLRWPLSYQKKSRAYASVRSRTYCHRSLVPRKSPDNRGFLPVNRGRTRTYRIILINAVSRCRWGDRGEGGRSGRERRRGGLRGKRESVSQARVSRRDSVLIQYAAVC